jgi:hypothetical protein
MWDLPGGHVEHNEIPEGDLRFENAGGILSGKG